MDAQFVTAVGRDASTAYIFVDSAGMIRFWNAGATALFGHDAQEALGKGVELVIPHAMRAAHGVCFANAMHSGWGGSTGWDPIDGLNASGDTVAVEVFLTPVLADGAHNGAFALFRRRREVTPPSR